jgi:hypothetical protein
MTWEKMVITWFLGILAIVIKNPAKQRELCEDLLHARDTITAMYPNGCNPTPPAQ